MRPAVVLLLDAVIVEADRLRRMLEAEGAEAIYPRPDVARLGSQAGACLQALAAESDLFERLLAGGRRPGWQAGAQGEG